MSDFARASGFPDGGVDPAVVAKWMSGARKPNPASCDLVADVLGADLDEVLALVGHRAREQPDDPRVADLVAMLRRVRLTDERYQTLKAMLDVMRRIDSGRAG